MNQLTAVKLSPAIEKVSFRNMIPEIPSTTYGTFGLYRYPAKFIPQIIAFILKEYGYPNIKIIDPFAGSGTTGLVARIYGFDYEVWDLNPMLALLHNAATMSPQGIDTEEIINQIMSFNKPFIPNWSKISYWYPEKVIPIISNCWGFYHNNSNEKLKQLILTPLLKLTRRYSYNDQQRQKLSRSSMAIKKANKLVEKQDWQSFFYKTLLNEIYTANKKFKEYGELQKTKIPKGTVKAGIDAFNESKKLSLNKNNCWNFLITSPPYLQAQEYIRNSKMDLFWLGYNENQVRELSRKELPYGKVEEIEICSPLYFSYRDKIKEPHLKKMYEQYLHGVLGTLTQLSNHISDYLFLFVGSASVRSIPIPIDKIFIEHFENSGWTHEKTYSDSIVSRVLFRSEINPANGLKDKRILTEQLVILRKKY